MLWFKMTERGEEVQCVFSRLAMRDVMLSFGLSNKVRHRTWQCLDTPAL